MILFDKASFIDTKFSNQTPYKLYVLSITSFSLNCVVMSLSTKSILFFITCSWYFRHLYIVSMEMASVYEFSIAAYYSLAFALLLTRG